MSKKITVHDIVQKKRNKQKITMISAYDYPFASLVDACGIDIVLVGDSLANVVLGLDSTKEIGMMEMLHHTKAAARGVKRALLVGDMPFEAYQEDTGKAVMNAKRFMQEAHCDAIKLEWFDGCVAVAESIKSQGIPVMGHVGLTPQTADRLGGMKVQGKDSASAERIIDNALSLEKAGCFSIVLECIPAEISKIITAKLSIPTIGIGAGVECDGQVLVIHDLLGLFDRYKPKFVKRYGNLGAIAMDCIKQYKAEVEQGEFPDNHHSYGMSEEELKKIKI